MEPEAAQLDIFESLLTQAVLDIAWRYCYRLCHQREDAEDLLQDALAHAYNRVAQLKEPAAFKSWLMCIIRSQFLMNIRRRRVEDLVQPGAEDTTYQLADDSPGLPANQETLEVETAMRRLPANQQEILALFYLDELSLMETARVLKLSLGAVQQRLFRARGALRREIERMRELEPGQAYASR